MTSLILLEGSSPVLSRLARPPSTIFGFVPYTTGSSFPGLVVSSTFTDLKDSSAELQAILDEDTQLVEDRETLRSFIFAQADGSDPHHFKLVNLNRIIQNAIQIFHVDSRKPSDLEPTHIIRSIRHRLIVVRSDGLLTCEAQDNATLLFLMHLCAVFAPCRVLEKFHLSHEAFDWVLGEMAAKFNQSLVNLGEMCRTLAAQSIGEPAMLNTFHYVAFRAKMLPLAFLA